MQMHPGHILFLFTRRKNLEKQYFVAPSQSARHPDREPHSQPNISHEKTLLKILIENYKDIGVAGRPVRNISKPVVVYFGMGLVTMDIVEKDNLLTLVVWLINVSSFTFVLIEVGRGVLKGLRSCILGYTW